MEFTIAESENTPAIAFDRAAGTFTISGESYPENVAEFYAPVLGWLDAHVTAASRLTLVLRLFYLNTGSTKALLDILRLLARKKSAGATINVIWQFLPNVELMKQAGEELLENSPLDCIIEPIRDEEARL